MNAVRAMTPDERQRGRRAALKLAADELERLVAEIPPAPEYKPSTCADAGERTSHYEAWRAAVNVRSARFDRVANHLRDTHGARITDTGNASRMTLRGVTCSCTGGLPQLFTNWVRKARAEVERLA
jgi:hypothetical protein